MTKRKVAVSKAMHKATVDIDMIGTVASAATFAVDTDDSASFSAPPKPLRVDRPFIYLIMHKPTGSALFMGASCRS